MTDDRQKGSGGSESRARPTARDVPFTRGAGSDSEPMPRGQRPNQLPRDPTYEAELANVELAVLRDRDRRGDPSTKQGGRAHRLGTSQPPDSVTPESPGARAARVSSSAPQSGDPPSSGGRAVASGTLLSVGAVDPRGRTEPTLETPRMFFSQPEGREAYFKPGKIPAVTVHQTLETETVKLSDSVDPRRAQTLPRIDRATLERFARSGATVDSEAPMAVSPLAESAAAASEEGESAPRAWRSVEYEAASSLGEADGQIHASLSPFRGQAEPSFSLNGAPTRPEPLAARREIEEVASLPAPDTSALPTQRDLPAHRIEASRPPPPPPASSSPVASVPQPTLDSAIPNSEMPSPTTASIAAPELPMKRATWTNYVGFVVALLVAVGLGLWLTRGADSEQARPELPPAPPLDVERTPPPLSVPAPAPPPRTAPPPPVTELRPKAPVRPALEPRKAAPLPPPGSEATTSPESTTVVATPAASRKSSPLKPPRETIF